MTIREVLEELRIETAPEGHHHVSEGWIGVDCPFCSPASGRFRLGIPEDSKGSTSCWTCGPHRLWESLQLASGRPMGEIAALCGGMTGERPAGAIVERNRALVIPDGVGKLLKPHRRYLKNERHLDPDELVRLWGIQGIGICHRLAWRIFIPIRLGEETVSWTTRAISDDVSLRYDAAKKHEEKLSSREVLYGAELARQGIVIVEGPIDAWTIGPGAVATCGLGYSRKQVRLMAEYPVRAICFDKGREAQKRAKQLCRELEVFDGDTFLVELESAKDANACLKTKRGRRELRELRERFLI